MRNHSIRRVHTAGYQRLRARDTTSGIGLANYSSPQRVHLDDRLGGRIGVASLLAVGWRSLGLWFRGGVFERLLEVGNDVVDVLSSDRDTDEVLD